MLNSKDRFRLAVLGAAIFVSMLGVGIIVPFLPIYATNLGATGFTLGLIFSCFSLARALTVPMVGTLSDRHGRKRFLVVGLLGYAIVAPAMIFCATAWELIGLRALHGAFAAMVLPVSMAIVADMSPPGQEGRIFGYFNSALLLGLGMGPLLGGTIFDLLGVNANFLIMSGLSLVSLVMVALMVKEPKVTYDPKGPKKSAFKSQLDLLKDKQIIGICLCRAGNAAANGCFLAFLPVLGQDVGITSTQVGLLLAANMLVMTGLQPMIGRLADRLPRVAMSGVGQIGLAMTKLLFPLAPNMEILFALAILEGLAAATVIPPLNALAVSHGRRLKAGMGEIMGLFTLAMSVGIFTGPLIAGLAMDQNGVKAAFWVASIVAGIGAVAVMILTKSKAN